LAHIRGHQADGGAPPTNEIAPQVFRPESMLFRLAATFPIKLGSIGCQNLIEKGGRIEDNPEN
jgi:hypothetical protein